MKNKVLSTILAFMCMTVVSSVSYLVIKDTTSLFLVASMGAASVIMYCAPNSPMATYRAFLLGNLISAVVGVSVSLIDLPIYILAPIAVGGAIGVMHLLRCQHPPGGATALLAVMGGEQVAELGYLFVLYPIGLNITLFFIFVYIQRSLIENEQSAQWLHSKVQDLSYENEGRAEMANSISIEKNQRLFGLELNIKPKDLEKIINFSIIQNIMGDAMNGSLRSLMNQRVPSIEYGDTIKNAWDMMTRASLDYLIVVDKFNRVDGIISLKAILELLDPLPGEKTYGAIRASLEAIHSDTKAILPESVGLMMDKVDVVGHSNSLSSHLHKGGRLPVVIVNEEKRYEGVFDMAETAQFV